MAATSGSTHQPAAQLQRGLLGVLKPSLRVQAGSGGSSSSGPTRTANPSHCRSTAAAAASPHALPTHLTPRGGGGDEGGCCFAPLFSQSPLVPLLFAFIQEYFLLSHISSGQHPPIKTAPHSSTHLEQQLPRRLEEGGQARAAAAATSPLALLRPAAQPAALGGNPGCRGHHRCWGHTRPPPSYPGVPIGQPRYVVSSSTTTSSSTSSSSNSLCPQAAAQAAPAASPSPEVAKGVDHGGRHRVGGSSAGGGGHVVVPAELIPVQPLHPAAQGQHPSEGVRG